MTTKELCSRNNPYGITHGPWQENPIRFVAMRSVNGRARLLASKAGVRSIYWPGRKIITPHQARAWTRFHADRQPPTQSNTNS